MGVVRVRMRVCKVYVRARFVGALPKMKNEWNKWKNHFYKMKGDVGMSLHEKERNKKIPTPKHKVTDNPIPTHLCFFQDHNIHNYFMQATECPIHS